MKIEEVKSDLELRIAYLMCNNDMFLDEIMPHYQKGMLDNKYHTIVVALCTSYYKKYNKAPKDQLHSYFDNALALNKINNENAAQVRVVLESFKNQPPVTDIDFEIDEAFNLIKSKTIKMVTSEADALRQEGKIEEAKKLLTTVESIDRDKVSGNDVYSLNDDGFNTILNSVDDQIVTLDGELGRLMNNTLVRNGFVTFIGKNKSGKSWWTDYICRMARNQGKKVILFTAGDMSYNQKAKRILQADAKTSTVEAYLDKQRVPCLDCESNQRAQCFDRDGDGTLVDEWNNVVPHFDKDGVYKPCTKCKGQNDKYKEAVSFFKVTNPLLTVDLAKKLQEAWKNKNNGGVLHIEHAPSGSLTCAERRNRIKRICKKYGWEHPDLIATDYADILAYEKKDERESTHYIWQSLRADADIFNCLSLTSTQANASSFDFEDLTLKSFNADRRKWDEVSAAFAINQTPDERKESIWRIACLIKREHPFDEAHQALCYGCLAMGTPHQLSVFHYRKAKTENKFGEMK